MNWVLRKAIEIAIPKLIEWLLNKALKDKKTAEKIKNGEPVDKEQFRREFSAV